MSWELRETRGEFFREKTQEDGKTTFTTARKLFDYNLGVSFHQCFTSHYVAQGWASMTRALATTVKSKLHKKIFKLSFLTRPHFSLYTYNTALSAAMRKKGNVTLQTYDDNDLKSNWVNYRPLTGVNLNGNQCTRA